MRILDYFLLLGIITCAWFAYESNQRRRENLLKLSAVDLDSCWVETIHVPGEIDYDNIYQVVAVMKGYEWGDWVSYAILHPDRQGGSGTNSFWFGIATDREFIKGKRPAKTVDFIEMWGFHNFPGKLGTGWQTLTNTTAKRARR